MGNSYEKLMKVYGRMMTLCYVVAFSWLFYAVIDGIKGILISSVLTLFLLFILYRNPFKESGLKGSLLLDFLYLYLGIEFMLADSKAIPSGVAFWLAGVLDFIFWLGMKKYQDKSFMTILKEEFCLPPVVDFAMILFWIADAVKTKDFGGPVDWLIMAFLLFDLIRQEKDIFKFRKKNNRIDMHTLKNDILTVRVKEHGAELASIKKGSEEYLWQADPLFWGRHSPVLFPIVGSVWDKKYRVGEKEFELGQHGFARDMDFALISASETEARYCLTSNEDTLKKYPWRFALEIAYRLHGNKLDVIWEVKNLDDEDMYFQIGAHPAFFYPDYDPYKSERGYLSFDRSEGLECIRIKEKGCVDAETKYSLEIPQDGLLPITRETFDVIDTIMLQDSQIGKVTLHKQDRTPWLALSFDAPVVGIWSPPTKNAPFICLEPWYGRCDRVDYTGDYREKDWVNRLAVGEKFSSVYTVEIF